MSLSTTSGKDVRELGQEVAALHPGLALEAVDRVAAERVVELIRLDPAVRAAADPGIRDVAMAAAGQAFEQAAERAAAGRLGLATASSAAIPIARAFAPAREAAQKPAEAA